MNITDVAREDIHWIWPLVAGFIQDALAEGMGFYNLANIHLGLLDETMRLWIVYTEENEIVGVAVCTINVYPQRTIATVLLMAGVDFDLWKDQINKIESWAVQNGASALVAYTRPGVAKKMQPFGFTSAQHYMCKNLKLSKELH